MRDVVLAVDVALEARGRPRLEARFGCARGMTVLFGPSGAGKSTCLTILAGAERATSGTLRFESETLVDAARGRFVPARRRRFALVPQSLALFPHMTARENVAYGIPKRAGATPADAWLERLRVAHVADRKPSTFSGGEAQRVALARALASEPRVLLLDEPFTALDAELREEIGRDLVALVGDLGLVAILVTHDRGEAERLGTWVVRIEAGRVTGEGSPPKVLTRSGVP